jgi:hypothetical protein
MIAFIKQALLRRQIRLQDERLKVARDMLKYYTEMQEDAEARLDYACDQLQDMKQIARMNRMASA